MLVGALRATRSGGRLRGTLAMPEASRPDHRVRPVFAAYVFGFVALALLAIASLLLVGVIREPSLLNALMVISVSAPALPFAYFAARGFRANRESAFQALPERKCGVASMCFLALALVLGVSSGHVGLALGPFVAAALFGLCVRSVRQFMLFLP